MTNPCHITGVVVTPDGDPAANTIIVLRWAEGAAGLGDLLVLPAEERVVTDGQGQIDVHLLPGSYTAIASVSGRTWSFPVSVPASAEATLGHLAPNAPPITPPLAVEVAGYRDEAQADAEATAADRIATGNDRVLTASDRLATTADRAQTALDRAATAADRVQTGLDRAATTADRAAIAATRALVDFEIAAAVAATLWAVQAYGDWLLSGVWRDDAPATGWLLTGGWDDAIPSAP